MEDQSAGVDKYIAGFPVPTQSLLKLLRETIKNSAPAAVEVISYNMPAYKLNGILFYFAAFTKHIGFYPISSAIRACKEELTAYKIGKGSIHFPLDKPLPVDLISRLVEFRVNENNEKSKNKNKNFKDESSRTF